MISAEKNTRRIMLGFLIRYQNLQITFTNRIFTQNKMKYAHEKDELLITNMLKES